MKHFFLRLFHRRFVKTTGLLLLFFLVCSSSVVQASPPPAPDNASSTTSSIHTQHNSTEVIESSPAHEEESHGDMSPMFFIFVALFIGVFTRHLFRKSPLPYTVTLLIIGIAIGVLQRLGLFGEIDLLNHSVGWAGNIDPHLILYIFLPTLIFEAAFAMDVYTFKRIFLNAFILAVPGIVVSMLLTAALIMGMSALGIGFGNWTWVIALLFGILISATDPVAVVSLLKELGTSKKLGTLVDGESLLNDGTAIVIFMVLFNVLIGISTGMTAGGVLSQFLVVALGGIALGVAFGGLVNYAVKKVFNDPLFEITIIVSAAYLIFFIAENLLHVSGVLGLVAYGLMMAGIGRTRISPEVNHFLHEFWELAAFMANTLIFIIVGVIIAQRTVFNTEDLLLLFVIYIGTTAIRGIMILLFFPLLKRFGYGIDLRNGFVLWYGGLKGAIGLALALIVAGAEQIPADIRSQILFYTAGIVALSSLINATTIGYFIKKLGLTNISTAQAQLITNNQHFIRENSEGMIDKLKTDRFMSGANWERVRKYLPGIDRVNGDERIETKPIWETRKRLLNKEKGTYWKQFDEGLLGRDAVQTLSSSLDVMMDEDGQIALSDRTDLEYLWKTSGILNLLQKWRIPILSKYAEKQFFNQLSMSYECARGLVTAQNELLKLLKSIIVSGSIDSNDITLTEEESDQLESEIFENRIQGLTFMRNLKEAFPEIYSAIETRQAVRSLLNHERQTIRKLLSQRRVDNDEAEKLLLRVEERMKALLDSPPEMHVPISEKMLSKIYCLEGISDVAKKKMLSYFETRVFSVGDTIVKNKKAGDEIFIIIRGSAKVSISNEVKAILSEGEVIGEMSLLRGIPRNATVTAESPMTALRLSAQSALKLMREIPDFESRLWRIIAERLASEILNKDKVFSSKDHSAQKNLIKSGDLKTLAQNDVYESSDNTISILVSGALSLTMQESYITSPCLLNHFPFKALEASKIFIVEKPSQPIRGAQNG